MAEMLSEVGGRAGENTLRQGEIFVTAGSEELNRRLINARTRPFRSFARFLLALKVENCWESLGESLFSPPAEYDQNNCRGIPGSS